MKIKMQDLLYKLLGVMLDGVSRLPFWVLYRLSDVIFVLVYYVVHYRRRVALENIRTSFPEKSEAECRAICRQFFRNFADYIVETIKINHVSDSEIKRRFEVRGIEHVDRLFSEGRSIAMYYSHCGNWEWGPSITLWSDFKPSDETVYAQVYRPLSNKWMDEYMLRLRSRFGSVSYEKRLVFRDLLMLRKAGKKYICGFMSDQKPSAGDVTHVVRFLDHPTAMITGTETIVRRLNLAALYWDVERVKRGYYRTTIKLMTDDVAKLPEFALTDMYARMLQETIRRTPDIWLWTHKRWKYHVEYPQDFVDNVNTPENK